VLIEGGFGDYQPRGGPSPKAWEWRPQAAETAPVRGLDQLKVKNVSPESAAEEIREALKVER
jgi:hypothetical protein